ncbi:MAG: hypothetical protein H8D67_05365 [Deltaproteobacteria bacterium]|nr:hypothetical protein [Deltaproteobacteria bacterium]
MGVTQKRIQLIAISPEDGVAFARYKNNGIYGIGPPFFDLKAVKNWNAILSRLGDFFMEEELVDFQSSFNGWDELAKYLQELYVKNNQALLERV